MTKTKKQDEVNDNEESQIRLTQSTLTSLTESLTLLIWLGERGSDLKRRPLMLAAIGVLQSIYRILEALSMAPSDDVIECCADLETYFDTNPLFIKLGVPG